MTTIYLKGIPKDIAKFILAKQGEIKSQKGIGKYSQAQAVIQMIRELKDLKEKK